MAYQEHQTFFCRYLGVPRQPKDSALIQALTKLEEYGETHAERKSEALKIYRRLARSLRDEQARDGDTEPDWLESLRTEAVFLDHRDRLVAVSDDMYIGDEPRLADAFKAHERISLLDVDPSQVPHGAIFTAAKRLLPQGIKDVIKPVLRAARLLPPDGTPEFQRDSRRAKSARK